MPSIKQLESLEDDPWDVFLADDDELDPEPEPGDFWPEEIEDSIITDGFFHSVESCDTQGGPQCFP